MPIVLTKMEEDGKGQPSERSSDNLHSQTSNREKVNLSDDPSRGLDQTLALLQQRNDTSRFVGLALLKSILDNKVEFQKDSKIISQCWDAVPVRFLDRLLKTGAGAGGNEEARDMVEIAVAVLHTFMMLLPEQLKQTEKFSGRIGGLLNVLPTWYETIELNDPMQYCITDDAVRQVLRSGFCRFCSTLLVFGKVPLYFYGLNSGFE